jgi:hypothetical protein
MGVRQGWIAASGLGITLMIIACGTSFSSAATPPLLKAALQRSLAASGFTMQLQTPTQQVIYQSPNRTSTSLGGFTSATIGQCEYLKVSPSKWQRFTCNPQLTESTGGRTFALGYLQAISDFNQFERRGSTYSATLRTHNVPLAMVSVYGNSGSSSSGTSGSAVEVPGVMQGPRGPLYKMTVVLIVKGGYIVSEELSIADPMGNTGRESLIYSHYGSSPAVHIPRVSG